MEAMRMNTRSKFHTFAAVALLTLFATSVPADDTDIFYGTTVLPPGSEPIVMLSIDYRPNLGSTACGTGECTQLIADGWLPAVGPYTYFDVLRAALRKVMTPLSGLKIGLMLNHNYEGGCENNVVAGCSNGGYIALGAELFEVGDANGAKAAFHDFLANIPTPKGGRSHSYQGQELFFEMYRYLTGQGIWNGHVGFLDYAGVDTNNLDIDFPAIAWDTGVETGPRYNSPLTAAGQCTKVFSVNVMFFVSNQDSDSEIEIKKSVASGGMGLTSNNPTFPEVLDWLNDVDLADGLHGTVPKLDNKVKVQSFFLVDPGFINTTTIEYSNSGGTGVPLPLDTDPNKLAATLEEVFRQILGVSTTFVAASVPVNVFNRAEVIDNIYLAVFQADKSKRPDWQGNVKKLKVTGLGVNPQIVDANGMPAIGADGRIAYSALTHWTDASALPPPDPNSGEIAGADGRFVMRGAAGQKIPGFILPHPGANNSDADARQLFFDDAGSLSPLDATAVGTLQTALGAGSAGEEGELIAYARGLDIDDLDGDGTRAEAREWIMSDPLHSRPLPLNYGTRGGYSTTNPAVYIAVASNDGFMRLLRNTTTGGAESGEEVWAFMPQSVMGQVKTLRTNAIGVRHPYLTDGSTVAYLQDTNINGTIDAGETAYLFFGLRRGGKNYYGLDISDPENPAFLWSIDKGGDFAELGYTFSTPRVITVDTGSGAKPALVFAGGYDMNKDGTATDDAEGNAIFVVDAKTGALIWKAIKGTSTGPVSSKVYEHVALTDSIPSTVSLLDSDGDTLHDRLYVGDTGGNVWRADLYGTDTSKWKLSLLATVGRHSGGASGKADDRRFFHRPDVVQNFDKTGPYDAVIIGAGDRADPLDQTGVANNWVYMIKDRAFNAGSGADTGQDHSSFGDITSTCLLENGACTADLSNGWALQLTTSGEKALSTATTLGGTVYFSTYLPPGASSSGACGPSEGNGRLYAVALTDAHARNNYDTTTDDEERFEELKSQGIPAEVVTLPPDTILRPDLEIEKTNAPTRVQTYWFESEDSDL
jgi:type IV pilus assembly protein PilY1